MSTYHQQDIDGCDYTMSVIMQNENRILSWSHTPGEFDKYDMDWTCESQFEGGPDYHCQVENKDRRWPWKTEYDEDGNEISVQDYDQPKFTSSFSSQMFNYEKYEDMTERYPLTKQVPLYTAGYQDGVWVCDLRKLPKEKIYTDVEDGGWRVKKRIKKQTMNANANKISQYRFLIPNNYGKILYKK